VLAQLLHKSRPYVSNMLVLTRLPAEVKAEVHRYPSISREILMAIARQGSESDMLKLWRRVKLANLSVHKFRESRQSDQPQSAAEQSRLQAGARRHVVGDGVSSLHVD